MFNIIGYVKPSRRAAVHRRPTRRGLPGAVGSDETGVARPPRPCAGEDHGPHTPVLEHARLVRRTVDGRVHQCSLHVGPLKTVESWLAHYSRFWHGTLDSLAEFAEGEE